jgi:hypothetical protein
VVERGGRLFVELAEVVCGWQGHNGMVGNMMEIGFGNFGMLVLDSGEGRMVGYA